MIVIDPGHGGAQASGGSSACGEIGAGGLREKDVTLLLARAVATELGPQAVLTRSGDVNLPLSERAALAQRLGARAFVSIHAGSGPAAYVHPHAEGESAALARAIIGERFGAVHVAEMAVLSPAVLGEGVAACLIEAGELAQLSRPEVLRETAASIARALKRYGQQALVRWSVYNPGDTHWPLLFHGRSAQLRSHAASSLMRGTQYSDYGGWSRIDPSCFPLTMNVLDTEIEIRSSAEVKGVHTASGHGNYVANAWVEASVIRANGAPIYADVGWGHPFQWVTAKWDDHAACATLRLPLEFRIERRGVDYVVHRTITYEGNGVCSIDEPQISP
jgi:hypothetical protein